MYLPLMLLTYPLRAMEDAWGHKTKAEIIAGNNLPSSLSLSLHCAHPGGL